MASIQTLYSIYLVFIGTSHDPEYYHLLEYNINKNVSNIPGHSDTTQQRMYYSELQQ